MAKAKKSAKKNVTKTAKKTSKKPAKKPVKKLVKKALSKAVSKGVTPKAKMTKTKSPAKSPGQTAKLKKVSGAKKTQKTQKTTPKLVVKSEKSTKKTSALNWDNLVTPLDDRLIVEPLGFSDRTVGGLFIPESAQSDENIKGIVLAVGRGRLDKKGKIHPMAVKNGEMVLFPKFSGNKINIAGTELLILRESDLLGTLT